MACETMIYEVEGKVGTITLNRLKLPKAINIRLCDKPETVISEIEVNPELLVVIITGGEKCFSSGVDIKETPSVGTTGKLGKLWRRIELLEEPVIAAVSGFALGGGFQLALACDLRIASETAQFGLPEIKLGLAPFSGAMFRLPRIIGVTKAKEMLFSGDSIDAQEAYRLGLVNKIVPVAALKDEAMRMASAISAYPAHVLKIAKKCVDVGMNMNLESALAFETAYIRSEFSMLGQPAVDERKKQAS